MCSSNSSLTAPEIPHVLRVNNRVVTAQVLPKVQPSSSPWEVEKQSMAKRVMYGAMFTALVGCTHKPGNAGWAKPPAEFITITGTSTIPESKGKRNALQMT